MSIIFEHDLGTLISSELYLNTFLKTLNLKINPDIYQILSPYSRPKKTSKNNKRQENHISCPELTNDINKVKSKYLELLPLLQNEGFLMKIIGPVNRNVKALVAADQIYKTTEDLIANSSGANNGPATVKYIQGSNYVFPENCNFFAKDVKEIELQLGKRQFDLILLDPPWWNKYIRRKRKKSSDAYNMMYNCDLKNIPIETLLVDDGMVVVWCTNSPQHITFLINDIFPKWNVHLVAKWFWLKVTAHGEPICEFSKPPGKQPFEQIFIATRSKSANIPLEKLIVSVPSAIHSHKPPLVDLFKPYILENNPQCLEVFARYLLPNWTSYGKEVLRFQHESLYVCT